MKNKLAFILTLSLIVLTAFSGCDRKKDDILRDGVLTVAIECANAPFSWTQSTDANGAVLIKGSNEYANGYDVMMAKKIAYDIRMELEIVKIDRDRLISAVQAGEVDCVISGQLITSELLQNVDFTEPYYYSSAAVLTKIDGKYASAKTVADLAGARCTSLIDTVWYNDCLSQIPNANILQAQETSTAMIDLLESGGCDIAVTDITTALAVCAEHDDFLALDFSEIKGGFEVSEEDVNLGISVQKGNTALRDKIDLGVFSAMTADDFVQIMQEAIRIQ